MDENRILSNSNRSDRLLKTKLRILSRTIKLRGVECTLVKATNDVYNLVHGYNNIDIDGDRSDESTTRSIRLVLNLNALEHVGEKSSQNQTFEHTEDFADEGDLLIYRSRKYEYAFRCSRKNTYGELDFLYEYEFEHFRTIEIGKDKTRRILYYDKEIDKYFTDNQVDTNYAGEIKLPKKDWTDRIEDLNNI